MNIISLVFIIVAYGAKETGNISHKFEDIFLQHNAFKQARNSGPSPEGAKV